MTELYQTEEGDKLRALLSRKICDMHDGFVDEETEKVDTHLPRQVTWSRTRMAIVHNGAKSPVFDTTLSYFHPVFEKAILEACMTLRTAMAQPGKVHQMLLPMVRLVMMGQAELQINFTQPKGPNLVVCKSPENAEAKIYVTTVDLAATIIVAFKET